MAAALRLTTPRLVLRPFVEDDFAAVHDYGSDPVAVKHLSFGPNTEADTRAFLQRTADGATAQPRVKFDFAVTLSESGRLIGGCGLFLVDEHRQGWIGYVLNKHYWGQGFGTELARALVAFGFQEHKLHRIYAKCDAHNRASAHVLEKAGMRLEGHLRQAAWIRGEWRDDLVYAVLDHEWKEKNDA